MERDWLSHVYGWVVRGSLKPSWPLHHQYEVISPCRFMSIILVYMWIMVVASLVFLFLLCWL